jgi:hypothetical protein
VANDIIRNIVQRRIGTSVRSSETVVVKRWFRVGCRSCRSYVPGEKSKAVATYCQ